MKRVLIVCVNFNTYKELDRFVVSIEKAAMNTDNVQVEVIVADNSIVKQPIETSKLDKVRVNVVENDNIGYLGGAQSVINKVDTSKYDYIGISNVDLLLSENFFSVLSKVDLKEDIAWIAPQIYSYEENRDINPKVINRYSKKKLSLLYYMYKFPILFYLYLLTAYKRKKLVPKYHEMDIYAGHGSFMLLTSNFFKEYKKIEYPIFLFGEELYLAELIRNKGMKVRYVPSLRVEDNEHVSTSRMKKKFYFKCNTESIKYILDTFYE